MVLAESQSQIDIDYRFISVDDHIDLGYLPKDLWTERLPKSMVERGPRVVELEDGTSAWVCEGKNWGAWAGGKRSSAPRSFQTALERAGVAKEGELRPTIPELRLSDMDRDNIEATVMFGPVNPMIIDDPALQLQCFRAYNDWLEEFCSFDPKRLFGVAMLPAQDPQGATEEVLRLAKQGGIRQVCIHLGRVDPPIYDEAWEPFWAAAEETNTIVSFHIFLGSANAASTQVATAVPQISQFYEPLVGLFGHRVLERHPGVKVVMAEGGAGWMPFCIQQADRAFNLLHENVAYWNERGGLEHSVPPSELFSRQVWVTFQDDEVAMTLRRYFGDDKLLWASDYPHPASTFPESKKVILAEMHGFTPEEIRKITRENALALYDL